MNGYEPPDTPLDASVIEACLGDLRGASIRIEASVASTNATVLAPGGGFRSGCVLLAEQQTAGRGRRGRSWVSPARRNVYATLAWDWRAPLAAMGGLSCAIGVGLAQHLEALGLNALALKWPNDLYGEGRKLAGVLIESRPQDDGAVRLAIGVGLNVHMQAPDGEIGQSWTSLDQLSGGKISRSRAAGAVARAMYTTLQTFERHGWPAFEKAWCDHDWLAGKQVQTSGAESLAGRACGVDSSGALVLDVGGTTHLVHAGEVSVRTAAHGG